MARSAQEGRCGERHPVESKASPSDIKEGAGEEGKERELQVQRDQPHPRGFENQASGGKNRVVWPLGTPEPTVDTATELRLGDSEDWPLNHYPMNEWTQKHG